SRWWSSNPRTRERTRGRTQPSTITRTRHWRRWPD
ncbi:uncharacterized protein METZ01_LOCUS51651, partial [marine metagenome]